MEAARKRTRPKAGQSALRDLAAWAESPEIAGLFRAAAASGISATQLAEIFKVKLPALDAYAGAKTPRQQTLDRLNAQLTRSLQESAIAGLRSEAQTNYVVRLVDQLQRDLGFDEDTRDALIESMTDILRLR